MEINHASDCALHNEPALSAEQCDCGAQPSEPDWETTIEQAFFVLGIKTLTRDEVRAELIALAQHTYRLGLAARSKVGDAELNEAISALRRLTMAAR